MGDARFIGPGTAELQESIKQLEKIVEQTAWNWKDWIIFCCAIIAALGVLWPIFRSLLKKS
ncbi:MAG: hypothetical protein HY609_04930 [Deltaproteobacteria bacterium]|nr:hypothetical protein [Deltaproteobacteria bacterium]